MNGSRTVARGGLLALLVCAALAGCARFRLPAIDPSGERLFLPCPNTTTLAGAPGGVFPHVPCPRPAWVNPPQPPACPPGTPPLAGAHLAEPALPAALGVPAKTDRVVLTPAKVIAPVGSEVVLLAGVCGADGHYITKQPIEWTLSQESVGQFVEVGEGPCHYLNVLFQHTPKKNGSNFAVGYTFHKETVVTRGTPTPTDDVHVASGQNWISVTSASEGTSHVTAFSPTAAAWDQRKQSATIHWVDAQWTLPPPTVARAGQKQTLATTVSRPGGEPIIGWLVRYEVTGGPPAGFAPGNSPAVEVPTDASGVAAAELVPSTNQPGVTQVSVQIIKPAGRAGDADRMIVGQGFTSVSWSAPGLAVKMTGPPVAGIGTTATYRAEVSNPGDLVARDVTASDALPPGLVHISSNPPGQIFGNRLEWKLGDIPGQTTRVIEINCRVEGRGDAQHCVRARSADGISTEGCVPTRLYSPALKVSMTGPEQATVNEQAQFRVEITNTGEKPLTNVTLTDAFEPGLRHVQGGASPLVNVLGELAPGETKRVAITFQCVAPGRPCHTLDVSATGEQTARQRACVNVVAGAGVGPAPVPPGPGTPRLAAKLTGTRQRKVGELAEFTIEVSNTGDAALTAVRVAFNYPAALSPTKASPGHKHERGELSWTFERLNPGQKQAFVVQCQCLRADPLATSRLSVNSAERMTFADEVRTEVLPAGPAVDDGGGRPPPDEPPAEPPRGELKLTFSVTTNPARVGQKIEFVATVANERNVSDKGVVLKVIVPEGISFEALRGPVEARAFGQDGRSAEFKPITELRAGESSPATTPFRIDAKAARAGKFKIRAEVRSQRSPQPVTEEVEVTVVGP